MAFEYAHQRARHVERGKDVKKERESFDVEASSGEVWGGCDEVGACGLRGWYGGCEF